VSQPYPDYLQTTTAIPTSLIKMRFSLALPFALLAGSVYANGLKPTPGPERRLHKVEARQGMSGLVYALMPGGDGCWLDGRLASPADVVQVSLTLSPPERAVSLARVSV
jgi:hypothetical protein